MVTRLERYEHILQIRVIFGTSFSILILIYLIMYVGMLNIVDVINLFALFLHRTTLYFILSSSCRLNIVIML